MNGRYRSSEPSRLSQKCRLPYRRSQIRFRVSGEAGRHQRSRYRRVESGRESKGESAIDEDVLGPAAVGIDANDFLNQAELFSALLAESTREASLLLVADAHAITRRRCITAEPASSPTPTNTHDLIAGDEWKSRVTQSLSMNWRSPRATLQCVIITGTSCLPSARS